jgi:hypothetical protein
MSAVLSAEELVAVGVVAAVARCWRVGRVVGGSLEQLGGLPVAEGVEQTSEVAQRRPLLDKGPASARDGAGGHRQSMSLGQRLMFQTDFAPGSHVMLAQPARTLRGVPGVPAAPVSTPQRALGAVDTLPCVGH